MKKPSTSMPITPDLKKIFEAAVKECPRSTTKKNLHADPRKDNALAILLDNAFEIFGLEVSARFERQNIKDNPALTFLYAQVTNAVIQKTIHQGSCHAQAAYTMIELAKNKIFNASLVKCDSGNELNDHWYLLILEEHTFQLLSKAPSLYIRVTENRFNPESIFLDPWSNQLCRWKEFKEESHYTKALRQHPQILMKSLMHIFQNEENIIQKILWCLNQFEKDLNALTLETQFRFINMTTPNDSDPAYKEEFSLLMKPLACREKLLTTLKQYQTDFTKMTTKVDDKKLIEATSKFFKTPTEQQWKRYPEAHLVKTKYKGHEVMYFNMKKAEADNANAFFKHLQNNGFTGEMKSVNDNPSIIIDLTTPSPHQGK
jgi:hypothetical protein